ncbi:MAG: hypothetical protein R3F33_12280 [Planctomycetota bacterium]
MLLGADVDLAGLVEVLKGRQAKAEKGLQALLGKLSNPAFVERADPEVVESERAREAELRQEIEMLARNTNLG